MNYDFQIRSHDVTAVQFLAAPLKKTSHSERITYVEKETRLNSISGRGAQQVCDDTRGPGALNQSRDQTPPAEPRTGAIIAEPKCD
ncbi:hypothetical protein EYF80_005032 [Liparis tanakae]|uniref:Uncharacterized protein n=1 Tax=Liparis tanakae TaxID=230148 RepID=A0A4Z2J3M1_9TELE|nr:hypothetical protein EYF80_005032 [Liparis tanakae]